MINKQKMLQLISSVVNGSDNRPMAVDLRYDDQVSNQPVVIFVHGFKGFKDWGHFPMVGEELVKAGFAFVSFNFTHDGTTLGQPTEFADLEAFGNNNYNKELFDTEQIMQGVVDGTLFPGIGLKRTQLFILGHSRGGGISITKAAENPLIKGLATWGSIADMKRSQADLEEWRRDGVVFIPNSRTNQEMPMYYQFVEDYFAQEERYDLRISCRKINVPGLFVHGTNDATVPLSDAENLAKWCSTGRALIIENGDHTFGGKHPFQDEVLPESSKVALSATIDHFKNVI